MAKANAQQAKAKMKGMDGTSSKGRRGRSQIDPKGQGIRATRANTLREMKVDATRPVEAGGTKHRGDRRDMSKAYTNNAKHASRGSNPRPDVSTRKR